MFGTTLRNDLDFHENTLNAIILFIKYFVYPYFLLDSIVMLSRSVIYSACINVENQLQWQICITEELALVAVPFHYRRQDALSVFKDRSSSSSLKAINFQMQQAFSFNWFYESDSGKFLFFYPTQCRVSIFWAREHYGFITNKL